MKNEKWISPTLQLIAIFAFMYFLFVDDDNALRRGVKRIIADFTSDSPSESTGGSQRREIEIAEGTVVHLCNSLESLDRVIDIASEMNYFLALNALNNRSDCPAYNTNSGRYSIYVISESASLIPGYNSLILFRSPSEDMGDKYSAVLIRSRTGLAYGAIDAIIDYRTESGINEALR